MQDLQATINKLQELSTHELYRLSRWIDNEINSPQRIHEIRNNFKIGDRLQWFDAKSNTYEHGMVISKRHTQVILQASDSVVWKIPYYVLNPENINTKLPTNNAKLTKNDFSIGEAVEFDYDGAPHNGTIIKLNYKTATIRVSAYDGLWRIPYHCLSKLIDSKANYIVGELE